MADKYKIDGVPPQNNVAGTEIPAYKKHSSKVRPILRNIPSQTFNGYRLIRTGNIAIAAGSIGMHWLNGEADEAHEISTAAQDVGAPVDQFSYISGAMQIRGADRSTAIQSSEQLYRTFNNILLGKDKETADLLQKYNVDIVKNENNTVNLPKTMENLAPVFKSQMDMREKDTLINTLAGNSEGVGLLREGLEIKNLLSASSRFGLTVDPEVIAKLQEMRLRTTEFGAAIDGIQQKIANTVSDTLTFKNALANTIGGLTDIMTYGPDNFSFMHTLGLTSGYESEKLRDAYNSNDFYQKLSLYEKIMLDFGLMTDGFREKYHAYIESKNADTIVYKDVDFFPGFKLPQAELNPLTNSFNFGGESGSDEYIFNESIGDTWSKNQLINSNAKEHYSFRPSPSVLSENNMFTAHNDSSTVETVVSHSTDTSRSDNIISHYAGTLPDSDVVTNPIGALPGDNIPNTPMGISPNGSIVAGPVMGSPIYAGSANGDNFNANVIADVIATAMQNNRVQIELTLIDGRTGETSVLLGQGGGRITYAMAMPM
ncbi:chemotaxis protein [Yersinia kristensenii]|uniref:chemotaxis protein n=1 Tax=Yersinia kristensenii TaxID=28152 RepID=UPI00031F4E04|nr:chemotaxis protein [Yersinia kristensenii]SUP70879.1 putative bacteriophage coat protein [Yersinia kristensenii]